MTIFCGRRISMDPNDGKAKRPSTHNSQLEKRKEGRKGGRKEGRKEGREEGRRSCLRSSGSAEASGLSLTLTHQLGLGKEGAVLYSGFERGMGNAA